MDDTIGRAILKVTEKNINSALKSGATKILSCSILLGLMEEASVNALSSTCFISDQNAISHYTSIDYLRPSKLGSTVTATAKIKNLDLRGVHLEIEARDEEGLIGVGKHTRVFIDQEEFERKCYEKYRNSLFKQ
ncbi:hypothetical protein TVAG_048590 [Trichomonas vaginalis G3]|uniref:Fluoroacetyl-CoA-specific thioesterase-like domain-containing protein n=1 Tax=Trichomonas vaginalis (strain ATCC PRA-98 / G3) TaxID=412133 RepID=A2FJC0_TRIV3|nr:thioesterase, BLR0278 family [Trichomonas vaginalis G3]EAX94981.1 hypothetical protein TVAG_048590 [Trichomonas vaginalis G3]KAI5497047.1 thioesterase, BLR0278 family [Trichomonas vaginalis G3]|eukprot:XP_001307911.1 hypothetical protein [Trichomonas vaginalis G3]